MGTGQGDRAQPESSQQERGGRPGSWEGGVQGRSVTDLGPVQQPRAAS